MGWLKRAASSVKSALGFGDDDDGEGMVLPEFAKRPLEEVGSGKLKTEQLPERVKSDLYLFVNEELDRLGSPRPPRIAWRAAWDEASRARISSLSSRIPFIS